MVSRGCGGAGSKRGHTHQLVLLAGDVGNVHVVGGGRQILELLASEDIDGNDVDLGVTVLAGLGGGHLDDLAGTTLNDDVTVLAQGRALHGVGGRRAGIGRLEGNVVLYIVSVTDVSFKGSPVSRGVSRCAQKEGRAQMRGFGAPQPASGAGKEVVEGPGVSMKARTCSSDMVMEGWSCKREN